MTPPNLFCFATSELTQDAFLAYLLSWANPVYATADARMHTAGTEFLRLLLGKHDIPLTTVAQLEVRVQVTRIDVLVRVKMKDQNPVILVIEDKVHAGSYNVLTDYLTNAGKEYPGAEVDIRGVYLRTGNQTDYSPILEAGFQIVTRQDLLEYLQADSTGNPPDTIFQNYRSYLERYQRQLDAFQVQPVEAWDGNAWVGFYRQCLLKKDLKLLFGDYRYVPNRRGGFQGCWWVGDDLPTFQGFPIYLQIEGSPSTDGDSFITIKTSTLSTEDAKQQGLSRIDHVRALADRIQSHPECKERNLSRPRLRAGQWMTAAQVSPSPELSPSHDKHSLKQLVELQDFLFNIAD